MRLRCLALAGAVVLAALVAQTPVGAVEPPPGTKNFTAPNYVPNYFSNESGPFGGGATVHPAPSPVVPMLAAPASRGRVTVAARGSSRHAARNAKGKSRITLARGKSRGGRQVAQRGRGRAASSHAVASRSTRPAKVAAVRVAHAQPRAAAKSRTSPAKGRQASRGHG